MSNFNDQNQSLVRSLELITEQALNFDSKLPCQEDRSFFAPEQKIPSLLEALEDFAQFKPSDALLLKESNYLLNRKCVVLTNLKKEIDRIESINPDNLVMVVRNADLDEPTDLAAEF